MRRSAVRPSFPKDLPRLAAAEAEDAAVEDNAAELFPRSPVSWETFWRFRAAERQVLRRCHPMPHLRVVEASAVVELLLRRHNHRPTFQNIVAWSWC